jgi:SAM-dependent methyltransferase
MNNDDDVPLRVDFRIPEVTAQWAAEVEGKRPWRPQLRDAIAARTGGRVLELGCGPGHLAERVLQGDRPVTEYVLLDFAEPMLALARERVRSPLARFVCRNFLDPAWGNGLGHFDSVITMQAVHELRHKRRASTLYRQVLDILAPGGVLVVCDHEPVWKGGGLTEAEVKKLSSTADEQHVAMRAAGFTQVTTELAMNDQYVIAASRDARR